MKRLPLRLPRHSSGYSRSSGSGGGRVYTPLEWSDYFDSFLDLPVINAEGTFRLYCKNMTPDDDEEEEEDCPLLILLHGAGYSALSWGLFAKSLSKLAHVKIVAIDLRGHGQTDTLDNSNLSSETLTNDVVHVYQALCDHPKHREHLKNSRVVLIGHSMGGAIATHASLQDSDLLVKNLSGLVVIDVVEGTALEALSGMQGILRSRPTIFTTLEKAIEWALRSGQTRNNEAARLSMPGMLKKVVDKNAKLSPTSPDKPDTNELKEEDEEEDDDDDDDDEDEEENNEDKDEDNEKKNDDNDEGESSRKRKKGSRSSKLSCHYEWRVNLFESQDYWKGWFTGLSRAFLQSKSPAKLLLLAGLDRLDKELTVGQMQGKFQMQVLPQSGHAIHEDHPDQVAQVIATFLIRNKLTVAKDGFIPSLPGC